MKKRILISIAIFITLVGGWMALSYFNSLRTVAITLDQRVSEATIFKRAENNDSQIATITQSTELTLQEGSYYIVPKGDTLSSDPIALEIGRGDASVTITPALSSDYLAQKLPEEEPAIKAALLAAFPKQAAQYTVQNGTLFNDADWYGGILRLKSDTRAELDWYRFVAHKEGGQWKIIGKPELVLTRAEYGTVPENVLRATNKLVADPTY